MLIKFIIVIVVLYILAIDQSTKNQVLALGGLWERGLANCTFNMSTLNHIKFLGNGLRTYLVTPWLMMILKMLEIVCARWCTFIAISY